MKKYLTIFARKLRKSLTSQELKLWLILKDRKFKHLKFRRQYVVDKYIVDFCCPDKKLIIELDGGGHAEVNQIKVDADRDAFLKSRGFKILRIWNNEIEENLDGVFQKIDELTN